MFAEAGDRAGVAAVFNNRGAAELDRGDAAAAIAHLEASLEQFTEVNDEWGMALVWCNLAHAMRTGTEYERAEENARKSVQAFEGLGDAHGTARSLITLALILGRTGQSDEGLRLHARAAAIHAQASDRAGLARSLEGAAWSQARLGDVPAAAWLLGHAETLREAVGEPLSADDRIEYDETLARLRSALEPDERAALWSAGHDAPLTETLHMMQIRHQGAGREQLRIRPTPCPTPAR